jgi:hypothetical protein
MALVTICCAVQIAQAQAPSALIVENMRALAVHKTAVDACLGSADFRKLPDADQNQVLAISKRIEHMANDLHETHQDKLLYASYSMALAQYKKLPAAQRKGLNAPGIVCDAPGIKVLDLKVKSIARSVGPYIARLQKQ